MEGKDGGKGKKFSTTLCDWTYAASPFNGCPILDHPHISIGSQNHHGSHKNHVGTLQIGRVQSSS